MPPAAEYFAGFIEGEPVCHVAVAPAFQTGYYRATRLVVMPEWQGAGVGTKFLEWVCEFHKQGGGRCNKKFPVMFHTSHPQLIAYFGRSKKWVLKSQQLYGSNKVKSNNSINRSNKVAPKEYAHKNGIGSGNSKGGYGGHFRAVQGFKYIGDREEIQTNIEKKVS